jgi:hypothetical protein
MERVLLKRRAQDKLEAELTLQGASTINNNQHVALSSATAVVKIVWAKVGVTYFYNYAVKS